MTQLLHALYHGMADWARLDCGRWASARKRRAAGRHLNETTSQRQTCLGMRTLCHLFALHRGGSSARRNYDTEDRATVSIFRFRQHFTEQTYTGARDSASAIPSISL